MCSVGLGALAVAVIGAAASYVQADDSSRKQTHAIEDGEAADALATAEQYKQINKAAMDEQQKLHTSYLVDSARIAAMQSESGLQGVSHDRTAAEAQNNNDADMATLEQNRINATTNAKSQSAAQSRRTAIQKAGIRQPSAAGTALQIGGSVADYYTPKKPPASAAPATVVGG